MPATEVRLSGTVDDKDVRHLALARTAARRSGAGPHRHLHRPVRLPQDRRCRGRPLGAAGAMSARRRVAAGPCVTGSRARPGRAHV